MKKEEKKQKRQIDLEVPAGPNEGMKMNVLWLSGEVDAIIWAGG